MYFSSANVLTIIDLPKILSCKNYYIAYILLIMFQKRYMETFVLRKNAYLNRRN
jgi:hypothetical protein